jgi:hypothetical protein
LAKRQRKYPLVDRNAKFLQRHPVRPDGVPEPKKFDSHFWLAFWESLRAFRLNIIAWVVRFVSLLSLMPGCVTLPQFSPEFFDSQNRVKCLFSVGRVSSLREPIEFLFTSPVEQTLRLNEAD